MTEITLKYKQKLSQKEINENFLRDLRNFGLTEKRTN